MRFERITVNPGQMGGQPCIRELRIPVVTVVAMVEDGMTAEEVVEALPDLDAADVSEALHFAAASVQEKLLPIQHLAPQPLRKANRTRPVYIPIQSGSGDEFVDLERPDRPPISLATIPEDQRHSSANAGQVG